MHPSKFNHGDRVETMFSMTMFIIPNLVDILPIMSKANLMTLRVVLQKLVPNAALEQNVPNRTTKPWKPSCREAPFIYYDTLSPKKAKTLLLNTPANSAISDSLICLVTLSSCHKHFLFWDNLFAMSIVNLAISLLLVNACKTGTEYWGCETTLFKRMSASRNSKVLSTETVEVKVRNEDVSTEANMFCFNLQWNNSTRRWKVHLQTYFLPQ